jgi:23S rRNA (adenine2503-C2)-methyltransferase
MTAPCVHITDLKSTQVQELITNLGEPNYRTGQLQRWIYRGLAKTFDEMADLPQHLRQKLDQNARLHSLTPVQEVVGSDETVKTLFALSDSKTIESTLMSYPGSRWRTRYTVCVSTQVGCAIGCPFCASGQQGFERNLSPGEIIDQVLYFARILRNRDRQAGASTKSTASSITNLVFMGMGEPLANYDALWQAIEVLNSPQCFGLGARNMIISTAGLLPQIKRLSQEKLQVGLAVSLHASDNALRDRLVPINRKYPLEQLIPACQEYIETTGRRITVEYILFGRINDSLDNARSLAALLGGTNCHVNLVSANRTDNRNYSPPSSDAVLAFEKELRRMGINCTLRHSRGVDVGAGCGQLRSASCKARSSPPLGLLE